MSSAERETIENEGGTKRQGVDGSTWPSWNFVIDGSTSDRSGIQHKLSDRPIKSPLQPQAFPGLGGFRPALALATVRCGAPDRGLW